MTRLSLAILGAGFLVATACAEEQKTSKTQQVPMVETAQNTAQNTGQKPVQKNGQNIGQKNEQTHMFANSNPADWREPDLENTLYITTEYGTIVVEMVPEFAPKHVEQIKKLTRQKFYDDLTFHRVIEGFMNQTGDPRGDGTGNSDLPNIPAEFSFRRDPRVIKMSIVGKDMFTNGEAEVGFYKAQPLASQPSGMAILTKDGNVDAWGIHCPNVASMARGKDVNSANSQFFLMRGTTSSLNQKYTVWGTTIMGRDILTKIKVGTKGETKNFAPDHMLKVRVAADVPENERISVEIMKTSSRSFENYLDGMKTSKGTYPAVCDIEVPSRFKNKNSQ